MDDEGRLTIDSHKPYTSFEEAQKARDLEIAKFINECSDINEKMITEEYCTYRRIAFMNVLTEFQTRIEEFEIG